MSIGWGDVCVGSAIQVMHITAISVPSNAVFVDGVQAEVLKDR
jgi:hypothetical protein